MPKAIVLVANSIAAGMAQAALEYDKIDLEDVAMISGRRLQPGWMQRCGSYLQFDKPASLRFWGQINTIGFYIRAVSTLKTALLDRNLRHIYIANSENILFSHALLFSERNPQICLSVLCDGNMNYQPISKRNRAWWRWVIKPFAARLMGLQYREPTTHLSGSYEPRVDRVIAYSAKHLQAPPEKVTVLEMKQVAPKIAPDPDTVLVLATALNQFMSVNDYERFKKAIALFVGSLGAKRILVKLHPNYDTAGIEAAIEGAEIYAERRSVEAIADVIPASRVIGYWTTGLMTLRQLRPDLECTDFGHDFYEKAAYGGDESVPKVLEASGVNIVLAAPYLDRG